MADSDVRGRFGQSYRAGRTSFDLVPSKLRRPLTRPGTVRRSSLIERLIRENLRPIVSVVAPAGYGKTTLLSQWAECHGQALIAFGSVLLVISVVLIPRHPPLPR
jgi:hypothetical protein